MAIKASCTVTLSCYRDTQSVTRYYKLQSSTTSAPSKPTTKPPSGWSDSEPSYTSGNTNTLYFCDLTVFSDGTWSYSTVSKSSSYEAAKEAYNKAQNAQNSANNANNKVDNLEIGGRNLLLGTGTASGDVLDGAGNKVENLDLYNGISGVKTNASWQERYMNLKAVASRGGFNIGDNLVASVYIKSDSNITCDVGFFRSTGTGSMLGSTKTYTSVTITPEWKQYWFPFVADEGSLNRTDTRIEINKSTGDNYIYWAGWKLEKGNKATDWSPAPEDQENIITSDIAPTDTSKMWFDTTSNLLKHWDGETWEVTNDYANDLNDTRIEITNEYNTAIEQLKKSITLLVDELQTKTSDNSQTVSRLASQIQQNSTSISQVITETNSITNKLSGLSTKEEISKWARFYGEGADAILELGSSNSPFAVKLSNTELGFYQNNVRIAYLSNQMLNISQAVVLSKLKFSHFEMNDIEVNGYFHLILK